MNMKRMLLVTIVLLPLEAPPALAQSSFANWGVYTSLGDSLTAGVVSNSLVRTHQERSYPALLARTGAATSFEQPLVSEPGVPPETILLSLLPSPVLAPKASVPGVPVNSGLPRPYNNLGVPGSTTLDLLTRITDNGGSHDLVLRGLGTALNQALALRPTMITLWIGNNDVLGAAVRGRAIDGVTLTPAPVFRAAYQQIVAALKTSGAPMVAANLPDVTTIPFVTTVSRFVINAATGRPLLVNGQPVPLLGPNGPIGEGSYVLLPASSLLAQGIGVPISAGGLGQPLPDEVVLDANEVALVRDRVAANNQAIRDICAANSVPVVDINAFLRELATTGRTVGGVRLSTEYLTGGVFSYDGVHPAELGYALVANEWIRTINANGGSLPEVDLSPFMGVSAARSRGAAAPLPEISRAAYEALLGLFPTLDRRD
jgi:lysophospholipase L1-like esterase